MRTFVFFFITILITANISVAQSDTHSTQGGMPEHAGHMSMSGGSSALIDVIEQHETAGTDVQPISTPQNMLMTTRGNWMFMLHGVAFLNDTQQTGPRGADNFFSTNWIMPMAQRELGRGTLTLRMMLSLEPATVSGRRYPLLFQQGETAFGRPIVDGQHPHDFFMELAAMYDERLSEDTLLSVYLAPMGSPALGPMAYPHRASASENPVATLGHHLQDSTHIADDVITVGLTHSNFRIEASGFHGREPDEFRWNIDTGKIDSWATRFSANPGQNWSLQYSIGQLHSPEALSPTEDLRRMTASVMYNHPFRNGNWSSLLLWGRNQSLTDGNVGNSYLAESTLRLHRNSVWTRIENTDRTNELLLDGNPIPPGFEERYFTRVQAYTLGYDREIGHIPHVSTAVGGQLTSYGVPDLLKNTYGGHPIGANIFLRVRIE
ncbi:MAG TPA: hypothetical protein VFU50_03490 [Terriglobales bacterium]|nr:hypothetical protein [Terriglobales bacterium]